MELLLKEKGPWPQDVLSDALTQYCLGSTEHKDPVHGTRVQLKKLKALLRLMETLGVPGARGHRRRLQVAGRRLGPFRELQILEKYRPELEAEGRVLKDVPHPHSSPSQFVQAAREVAKDVLILKPRLRGKSIHADKLADALERTLKRCRRAFKRCKRDPQVDHFHELRKRSKDLLYQLEILEPCIQQLPKTFRADLKTMTGYFGDANDWVDISNHLKPHKKARKKALRLNQKGLKIGRDFFKKPHAVEIHPMV